MSRHDSWASYLDPDEVDAPLPAAERAALDRIRGVLASPATWTEPPADLTASVLALAAADRTPADPIDPAAADRRAGTDPPAADLWAGTDPAAADPRAGTDPPPADPRAGTDPAAAVGRGHPAGRAPSGSGRAPADPAGAVVVPLRSRRRGRWIAAGSGIAAALALVLAIVLWPDPAPTSYPIAGTAAEPAATAAVTLDPKPGGVAITVAITGLPPSAPGTYYAAWLRGDTGTVPVGSFHWRKGGEPIDLWSGVEANRYPTFFITRQREGAAPTPSADVVLQGRVGP